MLFIHVYQTLILSTIQSPIILIMISLPTDLPTYSS